MPLLKFSRLVYAAVLITGVAACSSSPDIGRTGTYLDERDNQHPPAYMSATFNTEACDKNFSYIKVAVVNPNPDWLEMKNISVHFPYAQKDDFEVVVGERFAAWADSTKNRIRRQEFDDNMLQVAGLTVVNRLLRSSSADGKALGAALGGGMAASALIDARRSAIQPMSTNRSKHLLGGDIVVPPDGDRQYWMVLRATPDAPLMSYLPISFEDQNGNVHSVVMPLDNWNYCSWQLDRRTFLKSWAENEKHKLGRKIINEDGRIDYEVVGNLPMVEAAYQEHRKNRDVANN